MNNQPEESSPEERKLPAHPHKFSQVPEHEAYETPEPILDPTSRFEQDDRGEGMGVDDEKTYHRTEQ